MQDSIFTKIIKGEIPAQKIYEDEFTYAFLDVNPLTPGHTLVVPKKQVDHLWDLDDEFYQKLMTSAKKIAGRIREVLNPPRVGMHVEGFSVPHVHIHVYPLYMGLEGTIIDHKNRPKDQIKDTDLAEMAKKLTFSG